MDKDNIILDGTGFNAGFARTLSEDAYVKEMLKNHGHLHDDPRVREEKLRTVWKLANPDKTEPEKKTQSKKEKP